MPLKLCRCRRHSCNLRWCTAWIHRDINTYVHASRGLDHLPWHWRYKGHCTLIQTILPSPLARSAYVLNYSVSILFHRGVSGSSWMMDGYFALRPKLFIGTTNETSCIMLSSMRRASIERWPTKKHEFLAGGFNPFEKY